MQQSETARWRFRRALAVRRDVYNERAPVAAYKKTMSAQHGSGTWIFFRQWLKSPLSTAALSPSGRQLARHMMAELQEKVERVIELGAGTGAFTRAILERGVAPQNVLAIELNESLYLHLRERFPKCRIYCGDARRVKMIAENDGYLKEGNADAVISGLGLLSMSRKMQREILEAAFATLRPEGRFIQFTYGPRSPVSRELLAQLDLTVRRGGAAWWNLPPASVYVYTRAWKPSFD